MKRTIRAICQSMLCLSLAALTLIAGVLPSYAESPTPAEAKAIAEEGFIYGLPIVMNYAVMYEYCRGQELWPIQGAVQPDQERGACLHV